MSIGVLPEAAEIGVTRLVIKTADETVNNSAVLQNDDTLLFAVAANEKWQFEGTLFVNSSNNTPNLDLTFTGPTGAVGFFGTQLGQEAATTLTSGAAPLGSVVTISTPNNTQHIVHCWGSIANGANAGNLQLQWAQNVATAVNTNVYAGSYIKYQKQT